MDKETRKELISETFLKRYGKPPQIWTRAPGRVDLMGSHTDYNEGFVLTMTIDREVWLAASPRTDSVINIYSMNMSNGSKIDLANISYDQKNTWTNYIRGVVWSAKEADLPVTGFDGLIHSNLPIGSGVSSSAALEASVAMLLNELCHWNLEGLELAKLCQKAENDFVGMSCGILDQYTSILGKKDSAVLLDCRSLTHQTVPINERIKIVICDTRKKRELTGSEYSERRKQCELGASYFSKIDTSIRSLRDVGIDLFNEHRDQLSEVTQNRCQFIIEENQRVLDIKPALKYGFYDQIALLTEKSYLGARDLFEIGSTEYEKMRAAITSAPGIIGVRQAGAGFGGCMVAFVFEELLSQFMDHVKIHYYDTTQIEPHIYPIKAVPGAGIIK